MNRLITRDPVSGDELIVTRLWSPTSGVSIEGQFSLGWIGRLSPEQIDFIGLLLRFRNNLQRLAAELGVSYSTARSRLDEIVAALGGPGDSAEPADGAATPPGGPDEPIRRPHGDQHLQTLEALASGEITYQDALERLKNTVRRR